MKRQLAVCAGVVIALAGWAGAPMQAQGASQGTTQGATQGGSQSAGAQKGKSVTLSGCLAKGTDANSYVLNDAMPAGAAATGGATKEAGKHSDMKSYRLMAKEPAKLADHVGHRVEITGTVDEMGAGSSRTGTTGTGAGGTTSGAGGTTGTGAGGTGAGAGTTGGSTAAGSKSGGSMPHLNVTSMKHVAATCS